MLCWNLFSYHQLLFSWTSLHCQLINTATLQLRPVQNYSCDHKLQQISPAVVDTLSFRLQNIHLYVILDSVDRGDKPWRTQRRRQETIPSPVAAASWAQAADLSAVGPRLTGSYVLAENKALLSETGNKYLWTETIKLWNHKACMLTISTVNIL